MPYTTRAVTIEDQAIVASLVGDLLNELRQIPANDARPLPVAVVAGVLQHSDRVSGFLLFNEESPIGIIMLTELVSIYAGGKSGLITELYIHPAYRSGGLAGQLIAAAVTHGKQQDWSLLEVGAPPLPTWSRSRDFYLKSGFTEIGPRLRYRLSSG